MNVNLHRHKIIVARVVSDVVFLMLANASLLLATLDVRQFVHDARGRILFIVVNTLWLVPIIGDSYVPSRRIKITGKARWYYATMWPLLLEFCACAFEYTRFHRVTALRDWTLVAGLSAVVFGFLLSIVAWSTIQRYSSPRFQIIDGHRIVDTGMYRLIRHPICLSFCCIALGIAVLLESVGGLLTLAFIVMPVWLYVVRQEEAFLLAHFGEAYMAYQKKTRRLIPFVY